MPLKDLKKILERIKGHGDYVYLHVKGEPLMHPELSEILRACQQQEIKVNITTNGSLLAERLEIIEASPAIRQISISLQSMEAQKDQESYLSSVLEGVKSIQEKTGVFIELRLWNYQTENLMNKNSLHTIDKAANSFFI